MILWDSDDRVSWSDWLIEFNPSSDNLTRRDGRGLVTYVKRFTVLVDSVEADTVDSVEPGTTAPASTDWALTILFANGLLAAGILGALIGSALVRLGWF